MCNENEAFRALRDETITEIEKSLKADDGIEQRRRNSLEGLQDAVKQEEPEKKNISKKSIRKNKRKSEKLERKAKRLRMTMGQLMCGKHSRLYERQKIGV